MSVATQQARPEAGAGGASWLYLLPWAAAAFLLAVLPLVFTSGAALTVMNQMAITIIL